MCGVLCLVQTIVMVIVLWSVVNTDLVVLLRYVYTDMMVILGYIVNADIVVVLRSVYNARHGGCTTVYICRVCYLRLSLVSHQRGSSKNK